MPRAGQDHYNAYNVCEAFFAYEQALKGTGGSTAGDAVVAQCPGWGPGSRRSPTTAAPCSAVPTGRTPRGAARDVRRRLSLLRLHRSGTTDPRSLSSRAESDADPGECRRCGSDAARPGYRPPPARASQAPAPGATRDGATRCRTGRGVGHGIGPGHDQQPPGTRQHHTDDQDPGLSVNQHRQHGSSSSGTGSRPLLISGSGVRVPGGAPSDQAYSLQEQGLVGFLLTGCSRTARGTAHSRPPSATAMARPSEHQAALGSSKQLHLDACGSMFR